MNNYIMIFVKCFGRQIGRPSTEPDHKEPFPIVSGLYAKLG